MSDMIYQKTSGLTDKELTYCPGCTHGIVHKLVAEVLEELNVMDDTINVASVGCSVFSNEFFRADGAQAPHGRAPAVATGMKRANPNKVVFTYQGDGDLGSIGAAEIVHAANRSENITVIFVNNAIYGMTGGQMAPTTLPGQVTTTSPTGRDVAKTGYPLKVSEMLSQIPGSTYIERVAADTPANVRKTKKAIKKAFEYQLAGKGFTLVEILGTCNIGWGMSPVDSLKWVKSNMMEYFPLGVYRDNGGEDNES